MSHVAKIDFQVKDLDSLEEACKELGLELVRGQTKYRWYGVSVGDYPLPEGFTKNDLGKCAHAIRIPGKPQAYEIGVVKARQGEGYELLWDFWAGGYGMEAAVGKNAENLQNEYLAQTTIKHMRKRGREVTRERGRDGEVILRGRRRQS